jgi:hypothetical protein
MRIVVHGDFAVAIPEGCSDWDAACWINPGLLPDEYKVMDVVFISKAELEAMRDG